MKRILLLLAFVLGSAMLAVCDAAAGICSDVSPSAKGVLGTVELLDVIKPGAAPLAPGAYKLSRDWVGALTQVEGKQARTKAAQPRSEPLRLNCLWVRPDGAVCIANAWFADEERMTGVQFYRFFRFTRSLRDAQEILQVRKLDTLKSWLGKRHGAVSLVGEPFSDVIPDEVSGHGWVDRWMFFCPGQNETIVCQDISADAHNKQRISWMSLAEGVFRPANPDSEEERRMFPSENDKSRASRAEQKARIDAFIEAQPEPLQSLLRTCHAPDDPDLVAYKAAINRFRAKPAPLLIRQLVERLDDRTVGIPWLLQEMMDENHYPSDGLAHVPWKPENKKTAIAALIDSLPEAPLKDVEYVIIIILAETSLIALKMDEPEFSIDVRAFPRTPPYGGYGGAYGPVRTNNELARKTILNRIAGELRRRWEASGFCVERYSSTAVEK